MSISNISQQSEAFLALKWSIMMPTYNPKPHYFEQALTSILNQYTSNMEVTVIDNCSNEVDVQELIKRYGDGKVLYVRNKNNIGLVPNWNKCIDLARGTYIHILHDDDMVSKGFYEKAEICFSETYDVYACESMIINGQGENVQFHNQHTFNKQISFDDIKNRNIIEPPSIAFRKSVFESGLRFDENFPCHPDWKLWLDLLRDQRSIFYDSDFYNYYRVSEVNGTALQKKTLVNIVELELLYKYMEAIGISLDAKPRDIATKAALWELNSAFISGKDKIFFNGANKFSKLWGLNFFKALLQQAPVLIWKRGRFTAGKWKRKLLS